MKLLGATVRGFKQGVHILYLILVALPIFFSVIGICELLDELKPAWANRFEHAVAPRIDLLLSPYYSPDELEMVG